MEKSITGFRGMCALVYFGHPVVKKSKSCDRYYQLHTLCLKTVPTFQHFMCCSVVDLELNKQFLDARGSCNEYTSKI